MSILNTGPFPTRRTRWWGRLAMFLATCCVLAGGAMAQVGFSIFSQSSGTYVPITGTQLSANMTSTTGNGSLDAVSTALTFPGGFSFTFNGTAYTDCRVSTDGNITFGANMTNSSGPLSSGTAWNGVIAAAARDLQGGYKFTSNITSGSPVINVVNAGFTGITVGSIISGTGIPVGATITAVDQMAGTVTISTNATATSTGVAAYVWNGRINYDLVGTAPNRTLVVQWSNFSPFGTTLTTVNGARWNFQIRLNETTNTIDMVYGDCHPGVGTTSTAGYQVGLRGPNNTFPTNVINRTLVKGTNDWVTTTAGTSNASSCVFNAVAPANVIPSGLTFSWAPPPALNVAAGTIVRTTTGCFGASESLSSRITNAGTGVIDLATNPVNVSVTIGGAGSGTLTGVVNTGTLASGATLDVPLSPTANLSAAGTYTFATTVSMTGDGSAGDNVANSQIINVALPALPQLADFTTFTGSDLATAQPGWSEALGQAAPTGTTSTWLQANATQEAGFGTRTARMNLFGNTVRAWILAPRVAIVSATDELTFKAAMTDWNGTAADPEGMGASDDSVNVRISTNCGLSWTTIYSFNAANLNGITNSLSSYTVPLSSYVGQQVIIGIFATDGTVDNNADYDFHVDDIRIGSPPTCLAVTGLAISGISSSSISGTWNVEPGAGAYQWEVRTSGVGGSGATGLVQSGNVGTNSVTVSSLAANTTYSLWVRSDCTAGAGGFSTWVSVGAFTGYCVPTVSNAGDNISNFSTTGATTNISNPSGGASIGNYGDFTAQTVSASESTTFNYSLTYVGGTNGIRIWVDWNNNLAFEGGELVSSVGPGASPQTGSIAVPPGTPVGSYRMRVRAAFNVLPAGPCGNETWGETEDYTLQVLPAPVCFVPTGFTAAPQGLTTVGGSWTASPTAVNGYIWEVRTSGNPGDPGAVATGTSPVTSFSTSSGIAANTTYQVYVRSDCAGDGLSSWVGPVSVFTGYCIPGPNADLDDNGITNVTFANVDEILSTAGDGGYTDLSAVVGLVGGPGNAVPISVNVPTGFTYDMRIWIDWNNDLDFTDAGELVAGGGTNESSSAAPWVTSFTVPPSQAPGNYRMRIGGADSGITGPCYAGSWRAFVDFTVSVCASPTDDGTIVVDDCVGQTFQVEVTVDLAGSASANVEYSLNGVAQTPVSYSPGVAIGPFASHLAVDVNVVTNTGCSVDLGTFVSACDIELDCETTSPIQMVHCYENGDTRTWTWVNTEVGGTVALKFTSGTMDGNDNVEFWEGAVGVTPASPASFTGTLSAGGIVTSVGNTLSMSISTDGSNSCATGEQTSWVFEARCGGCVEPVGYMSVDENELGFPNVDCVAGTFDAYFFVEDFGIDGVTGLPPTTVGYILSVNNTPQAPVTGLDAADFADWYPIGTFPIGTLLDLEILHGGQSQCDLIVANDVTVPFNACPPANDQCVNATVLTVNSLANCPANAVIGTTLGADQSGAQPTCATGAVQDVWYSVDITGWATPRLTITDGTATVVGVQLYNDCLTPQGYCTTDLTQFTFLNLNGLTPGVYYVRVFTTAAGVGNFSICVSSPGPAGYECDAAITIPSVPVTNQAVVCTGVAVPGLLNATTVPVACGGASNSYKGGEDALYAFTPTVTGNYTISYNGVAWSSIFVYSGACPTNGGVCVNSVGSSASSETLVVPMTANEIYYIWFDTWPTPNSPCPGTFSISEPVVPCAGTPAPGNTLSSPALACSGSPIQLSLQNNVSGVGISYAWEFSTDGGANWTPIGGNTSTLSTTITVATEFRANVTCANSGETGTSVPVLVGIETDPTNCYCVPVMTQGCTDDDVIARVQLNTLDNNTGVTCPSGITGYSDYTSNPGLTTELQAGNTYNCTVTVGPFSEGIAVWIDFDDNGVFDHPSERVGFTPTTISASATLTFPIVVSCSPALGTHRMRVRARFVTDGAIILPCEAGSYGETEDYLVTITEAVACPAPSLFAASPVLSTSANLTWQLGCDESEWVVEYGPTGFSLGSGTQIPVSGTPGTVLSPLTPSTAYQAYVRADCDGDGFSTWVGPLSFSTPAPPPANDDCAGAIALTVNADYLCGVVTSGTTGGATASPQPDDGTGTPNDDVWFSFVATNNTHRISLNNLVWVSGGQLNSTDMAMTVYLGPCADGGMIQVGTSDPETYNMTGLLIPGQTYYVRVSSWSATTNHVNFNICVGTPPPPPANDDCAGAVALTVNAGLTCTSQTAGTVQSATNSGVAVTPCVGTADDDVWYTFQATQPSHTVSLNSVAGSVTDMNFQVFSGACGGLTSIACGATGSAPSTTVNGLTAGSIYYVRVYTNTATTGQNTTFNICVNTPPLGPPANDECAAAIGLTVNTGQTCTAQTAGTVLNATGTLDATCTGGEDDDVWFSFVALTSTHTVRLNNVAGSVTNMNFQVLSGACGTLTSIVCSNTGTSPIAVANGLTAGTTYFVRVYTNTTTPGQNTTFNVCVTSPPANNLCADAIAVACNTLVTGTTAGSSDVGEPATCGAYTNNGSFGVWYTVQGWGGPMIASLCGSSYDTQIGVFTGSCGSFTCVAGDDEGCGGVAVPSRVTWNSVAGTTYYLYVTGWAASQGTFQLGVSCGSTAVACASNGLNLEFQNDANPGQVTWEVLNQSGNVTVVSGANPIPANSIGTQSICLPNGCYRLRVLDSAGDGMTTGGYELRNSGDGARIIDNTNNFSTGSVSAIASGGSFCLPIGTDKLIYSSCDKLDWVNNKFIVASANPVVTAQFGVTNTTSGYEFWFFDPNGTYSYRRFRSHATSDGFGSGATRACHFKVNGWVNSVATPHLPANVLLNVRVRGREAGNNLEFGPACQFKIDPVLASCPRVSLQDDPANADYSCGVSRNFGGSGSALNRIYAKPPQPVPAVASSNVRYQFRFRIPGENICIVRPPQTSAQMTLNWTAANGPQLECTKTYEVDVRVSLDGGASWCFGPAGTSQAAACADTEDWGRVCNVTINPCANVNGGSSSMVVEGNSTFTMYPNPNRGDQLFMSVTNVEEGVNTVSVDIFDMTGKRVMARTIAVQDGFVNTNLELNGDLAGGLYMVNITAGTKAYTERLVIQP